MYSLKESTEGPTYGPMKVVSNGNSYMEFNMQISAVGVRDSSSDKSISLGTWRAGFDNNLTLLNSEVMSNYTADVVYRIVTVEVGAHTKVFVMLRKSLTVRRRNATLFPIIHSGFN